MKTGGTTVRQVDRHRMVLLGLAFTLCARLASAGTIGITTTVSTSVEDDTLKVKLEIRNTGDEQGYNLNARISAFDRQVETHKVPEFAPGKPIVFIEQIPITETLPGTYPLIVKVFCTDANQYPFSALASHVFAYGADAGTVDIAARMEGISLAERGALDLKLKNMGSADINASVRLVTPRELTVEEDEMDILLPGRSDRSVEFVVENFSARPDSTYPLVAFIEYAANGVHQTTTARGTVAVTEKKKAFGVNYSVFAIVLVALVAVFIALEKFKK